MRRVKSVEQLAKLALARKAVHVPHGQFTNKHMPAAFMVSLRAKYLLDVIRMGMFVYKGKK